MRPGRLKYRVPVEIVPSELIWVKALLTDARPFRYLDILSRDSISTACPEAGATEARQRTVKERRVSFM